MLAQHESSVQTEHALHFWATLSHPYLCWHCLLFGLLWAQGHRSNFLCRDVLNVLGMYPGDPGPPGSDYAGVVMRVGKSVNHLKPGKME